ncbi:MAG TPA: dTDP-4-dehydrorhamnose 3,5-epimerase family protein [Anaerolineae bacterium]|nr:dTDP-4-dehydrorhamnose 3,5-epimerase family protein [Anaerolineae bacterium]
MIHGVELKTLVTHADERGFFRELIRVNDPIFAEGFGQWSHTVTYQGAAKAWHIHQKQVDWWYVALGVIRAVMYDLRNDSPTHGELQEIFLGDNYPPAVLKVPPGVAHGYKVIQGPMHLFYLTSSVYNPDDEGRIPHDDKRIGYDWRKESDIK